MSEAHPALATFRVYRDQDVSGVSGTGVIAEGCQFSTGWVVTHWLDQPPMNEPKTDVWYHKGTSPITKVHGHGGATRIVWTSEEDQARRKLAADVLQAFDVPPEILGHEVEADVQREELTRRLRDAAHLTERNYLLMDGFGSVPQPEELTGYLPAYVDAVMPMIEGLIARRDQLRATVGQAYSLAGRWLAAHGSSYCLVRAVGAELRDALTGDSDLDSAADNSSPDIENEQVRPRLSGDSSADTLPAVECSAEYHGFPGDHRQCIRAAQHRGDHIDDRGFHWSDTVAVYPVVVLAPDSVEGVSTRWASAPGAPRTLDDWTRHVGLHGRFVPEEAACRIMETRICPPSYTGPCGERPCARFESDDPGPWIDKAQRPAAAGDDKGRAPTQPSAVDQHERPAGTCSSPDHACENCGECVRQHPSDGRCVDASQLPPNQGPLSGIEVRDPGRRHEAEA
jgi:hypothetical protein